MTDNGFVFDLNKITRREYRKFVTGLLEENSGIERDQMTGDLLEKVCLKWPYDKPITADEYLDLGLTDSNVVDAALTEALAGISQKK